MSRRRAALAGADEGGEPVDGSNPDACARCRDCAVRERTFCCALPPSETASSTDGTIYHRLSPGGLLVAEGEPARSMFVVLSGCLRTCKTLPDGRRLITGFKMAGDYVGLSVAGHYAYDAEAVGEAHICEFALPHLRRLMREYAAAEHRLLRATAELLAEAQDHMLMLGRKNPMEKVATFLYRMAQRRPAPENAPIDVELPMSRTDVADYLGLTIETVSRSLTRLREQGVIAVPDSGHVSVIDADALRRHANL